MRGLLGCLLLLGGTLRADAEVSMIGADENSYDTADKTFVVETGASPGKLAVLNDVPPPFATIIFLDAAVGSDGKIGYWQFFTNTTGRVCFGVYNKVKDKAGQLMVESAGRNCMNVTDTTGFQEIEVPMVQRLSVNPSSVIALEYDLNGIPPEYSVVTLESNMKSRSNPSLTLGSVMVQKDSDIHAGEYFFVEPYFVEQNGINVQFKAFPSFKAIIVGKSNVLDLRGGDDSRSGVAMIFMNGVWGTICDRWYHEKGWPFLMCAEKDYPDTEMIYYTDSPERHLSTNTTPIHLMNPRCKFSQNVTMFSCATHDNVTCNHTNDLYIKCKSKVDLRKGAVPSEGICYVYESNYWGSICDKRDLGLIQKDKNHWAHVCCRERGFGSAREIKKASDVIYNQDQSVALQAAISMHSPTCTGATPVSDITLCRDGPLENRCDHQDDVYVYCQM